MVKTIGNPLSWTAEALGRGAHWMADATGEVGGARSGEIEVRRIELDDLRTALARGVDDFLAFRSDVIVICLVYPLVGALLVWFAFERALLPLVVPLIVGFALLGPVAAIGLYEMSRRRELRIQVSWGDAFAVMRSPAIVPILILGSCLLLIFVFWLVIANGLYAATLGPEPPVSFLALLRDTLTTGAGWTMLIVGGALGLGLAALVLAVSIVSFPLLLDRHVGLPTAVTTSLMVVKRNPVPVAVWGLIVATSLAFSAATLFIGLIFALPVLGHGTWHLYRRAIGTREEPNALGNDNNLPDRRKRRLQPIDSSCS
jgi:uncharacterized membrane protein